MSSYLPSNIGPSPFLTASPYQYTSTSTSSKPHYTSKTYSNNVPTYLAPYALPAQTYHEKYFPKEIINVLPGVTNLQSEQEEKIIHPLNTYSGNVFNTHRINSPFNRGEIYPSNKPSVTASSYSDVSAISNIQDLKPKESYLNTKQNPFTKKYLLSQKNQQLQTYANYFPDQTYQFTQSSNLKSRSKSPPNHPSKSYTNQQIANQVIKLKSNPKINISNRQDYRNQTQYNKKSSRVQIDSDKSPFDNHILGHNYQEDFLVESEVDQKQFGSFGQGKDKDRKEQFSNSVDVLSYRSYDNSKENWRQKKIQHAQSLIAGLSKMTSNENNQQYENYETQKVKEKEKEKSKKQLIFVDSDDDQRRSGTFVVPNAIIDEINNTRVASNAIRKRDPTLAYSYQKYEKQQERPGSKYRKEEAIQVGKNPPSIITMRGKTYEKISL